MEKFDSYQKLDIYNNILGKNVYTLMSNKDGEIMLYGRATNIRFLIDDCLVTIQTPFYKHICSYKNIIVSNHQELSYGDEVTYCNKVWCISDIKIIASGIETRFINNYMYVFPVLQRNLVLSRQNFNFNNNIERIEVLESNVHLKSKIRPFHIIIEPNKEELAEKIISELPFCMFYEKLYVDINNITGVLYTFHKRDSFDAHKNNFSDNWYMNVMSGPEFATSEYAIKSTMLCYPLDDEDDTKDNL